MIFIKNYKFIWCGIIRQETQLKEIKTQNDTILDKPCLKVL